jgi:hypothetical protein
MIFEDIMLGGNYFTIDTEDGYIYNYCNVMFPDATMTYVGY